MEFYEIPVIVEGINRKYKESWEQTRFISYITAQVNSSKQLKPTDILKFAWDVDTKETYISKDDIERLKNKSKEIAKQLK
ncbi:hypothetical protein [Proteiniphilum acetatigenes]|uniref:hypothetical protein n=1 Tax=Proteiniphilum acetatigenes TaxID=294710 RepID=UPI000370BD28|nr:hypothetical protein [Proteiniphilum acetatigenes]